VGIFSLFVLAMAMVAGLTEASLVKGLLSTAVGLLITVIGTDPIASVPRFTFGSEFIGGGFPVLPVLIGIFAFAQIMTDIEKLPQAAQAPSALAAARFVHADHDPRHQRAPGRAGAYALNNTMQGVYVLLIFGVVGYAMVKVGMPLAPLILGLILGDQIELNLIRAIMNDSDPWLFFTRPISGGLLLAAALSVVLAIWQHLRHQKRTLEEDTDF
jgi:TctA family transporter